MRQLTYNKNKVTKGCKNSWRANVNVFVLNIRLRESPHSPKSRFWLATDEKCIFWAIFWTDASFNILIKFCLKPLKSQTPQSSPTPKGNETTPIGCSTCHFLHYSSLAGDRTKRQALELRPTRQESRLWPSTSASQLAPDTATATIARALRRAHLAPGNHACYGDGASRCGDATNVDRPFTEFK